LRTAQGRAVAESQMKAPVWLLPASLDLVVFVLVLFGAAAKPRRLWHAPSGGSGGAPSRPSRRRR
jgi:hypothetical protein